MAEDIDEGLTTEEKIEKIRETLKKLRAQSLFLKFHRNPKVYDEFILALDSADFHFERLEVNEGNREIDIAKNLATSG